MTSTPPMNSVKPVRLWRWRRNPLRRHSDVVEAWIVLVTWICALSGGTLAGVAAAQATDSAFAARQAQVHAVSAVLTDDAARTALGGSGYDDGRVWAVVRWTTADGAVHTDRAKVLPGLLRLDSDHRMDGPYGSRGVRTRHGCGGHPAGGPDRSPAAPSRAPRFGVLDGWFSRLSGGAWPHGTRNGSRSDLGGETVAGAKAERRARTHNRPAAHNLDCQGSCSRREGDGGVTRRRQ